MGDYGGDACPQRGRGKRKKDPLTGRVDFLDLLSGWVEAGQSPSEFWRQTPASFDAVIAGVRRRSERDAEFDLWRAYTVASLSAVAQAGKLKPFSHYRRKLTGGSVAQTPQEMLQALKAFQSNGAPMKISRIEGKPQ